MAPVLTNESSEPHADNTSDNEAHPKSENIQKKGLKFWLVFLALCVSLFLSALDFSAIANALPVIIHDLQGEEFAWVGTAYGLSSVAFLPLSGCLAEVFGRKSSFVSALLIFALGSALCGSAQTMTWLIAARTVQGIGGGAIVSLSSIIVGDMVPLRERGAYNGMIGMTWTVAVAIGPLVGGALAQNSSWRWLFYLNLPICGVALALVLLFVQLPTPPGTLREKMKRLDWIGNGLVISASTSLVIALTWGGSRYPWSSARVLVPLILGIVGLVVFFWYEMNRASYPMVPKKLLSNRTSVSGYIQVFANSLVVTSSSYYFPVYFQACKDASPIRSSVDMFGVNLLVGPVVVIAGISVTVFKSYRPQLWIGWILSVVGVGAMSTVGADTPIAQPIGLATIWSGSGLLFGATYFPVLSPLPVSENARALALFAFVRFFAQIWGITIGSVILTNQLRSRLPQEFLAQLGVSVDNIYSIIPVIKDLAEPLKGQVREAFAMSLRVVWYTLAGVAALGLLASLMMKDVPMHNYVDEKWAMQDSDKEKDNVQSHDQIVGGAHSISS